VISQDEDRTRWKPLLPGSRSAGTRYGLAVVAALAGMLVTAALFQTTVSDQPIYAPMIGAVALTAWYGGFGPSLLAIALAWSAALWLFVDTHPWFDAGGSENVTRWWINLVVVLVIAGLGGLLRMRVERAAVDATSARDAVREIESLQQLSVALAGALSSSDVARVVTGNAAEIVSARGVALALLDGGELGVVDPTGLAAEGRSHGDRLALEGSSLLSRAVRDDEVVTAVGRAELEGDFDDTASVLPDRVEGAIAVPLRSRDRVVGSLGFVFDRADAVGDETVALAVIMGDLAAQALERARLYERERESRAALDRILQVAPRFLADDADDVIQAICREARTTFGADFGVLWRIRDDDLALVAIDPPQSRHAGTRLSLEDFPRLRGAMFGLEASFVPDVLETTYRDGLGFVRELGIRSSLRTPIVIAGVAELVLAISWQVVISEPDTATVAVVRRFADQAGLALEQLERRRAQAAVAERAESTRRLQDVTAALSRATTIVDVSNTCLEHALESVGAEAGFVVLTGPEGTTVEIVSTAGYDDAELATWHGLGPGDDVPFARAISSGEPVWAFSPEEMAAFADVREPRSSGWATIPLQRRDGASGALHLSLRSRRMLSESERDWLQAMVSQCSQAMERSALYEEEQRSRRRAERVQSTTASLSNALTTVDVARVVVAEVASALDADEVGIVSVNDDGKTNGILAWEGDGQDELSPLLDAGARADTETPAGWAIRARRSLSFESPEVVAEGFPAVAEELARAGAKSFLLVPLVAARRTNALLLASWRHSQRLSRDDRSLVEVLAAQAAQALDRARHFESEQTIAETLQRSVLPVSLPRLDGVQLAARYLPGTAQLDVGGDWFDAVTLPDGKLALIVGDVVGKGVQAAASMAQLRNAIRAFSLEPLKPSSALARLNRLAEAALDTTFATVAYLVLDPETGLCRAASAGHPPPLVAFPDGRVEFLERARGLPLGTGIDSKYRQQTIELPAGAIVVLYTDGLVERRGRSIDDGLADLRDAVAEASTDPDRLLEHVLEKVVGSGERGDDIALLAARVLPVAPRELDLRVPVTFGSMELVRDAMRAWLRGAPAERGAAEDVVLATWEACANAIEHAVDPTGDVVSVRASLEDSRVRVVVKDSGTWAPYSIREDRGLGLRLIEALSSSFDVSQDGEGTTVTLEKQLT
jgi:serine phosphatase RsbU (regulator of sigma subunit)/anti-sigma regulatory factor (Ser/Thr protein kinase)